MSRPGFFAELKRRNVYKVAVAYAVVGWLVMQVSSTVVPALHLPDSITTTVVVLVLLGFPIALVIAWAYEMTPEGMKRTDEVAPGEKQPQWSRRKFAAFILMVVICAAALLGYQIFRARPATPGEKPSSSAAKPPAAAEMKSVAVLPFANLSGDPANEYFSDGITEEILNAIAHVPNLRVAARTSSFAFKGKNEDIAAIARNLRVTNVLEGSVQRMGDRMRVTAQLIDASSGLHLWSDRFDGDAKDLFAVQDKIAQAIARALKLTFEGRPSVRSGTENLASHDAYLKALEATSSKRDVPGALRFIDQAIALDPKFAAAYALKAKIFGNMAFFSTSTAAADQYLAQGEIAAKRAVELDPNLADGYYALGEIARKRGDEATAIENFTRATKLKPADPAAWQGLGLTSRDWAASLKHYRHAKELGSTDLYLDRQMATALDAMGRVEEAHQTVIELHRSHPEFIPAYVDLGRYEIWLRGRPDRALQFFVEAYRKAPAFVDANVPINSYPALVFILSDHLEEAEQWLARASATAPDSGAVAALQLLLAAAGNNRAELAKLANELPSRPGTPVQRVFAGDAAILSGNFEAAADIFRALIDASSLKEEPKKSMRLRRWQLKLGYSLSKLGKTTEAASALQDIHFAVAEEPRFSMGGGPYYYETGSGIFYTDAELYAARGEKEKSLAALKSMLTLPDDGLIPIGSLPVAIEDSPLLGSVRDTPEFAEFRNEVARRRAIMKQRVEAMRDQLGLAVE